MARAKKPAKYESKVVRFSRPNYDRFVELKSEFAVRQKKTKITFDAFIEELFTVAELLIHGREVYLYEGRIYPDLAEARGAALMDSIHTQRPAAMPTIMLVLGEDTFLKDGK